MAEAAEMTAGIAIFLGVYALAASIGALLAPRRVRAMFDEIASSPSLQFMMAVLTLLLGAAILIAGPGTGTPLATVVTVIAWIEVIEGIVLFVWPHLVIEIGRRIAALPAPVYAIPCAIGGAALIAAGYFTLPAHT